jgi:hypothetical protein
MSATIVLRLKCNNATECYGYVAETLDGQGRKIDGQRSMSLFAEKRRAEGKRAEDGSERVSPLGPLARSN